MKKQFKFVKFFEDDEEQKTWVENLGQRFGQASGKKPNKAQISVREDAHGGFCVHVTGQLSEGQQSIVTNLRNG